MKEYIERDWLVKEAEAVLVFREQHYTDKNRIADAASTVEWLKYYAPAADVVEVRHGRWENGECSNCKFDLRELTDSENDLEQWVWDEGFDYCPHCGCKMDRENA